MLPDYQQVQHLLHGYRDEVALLTAVLREASEQNTTHQPFS